MLLEVRLFILIVGFSFFCVAFSCMAKDLGVQGTVFEIKEQSLLEVIEGKLRVLETSNKLGEHQKELQKRVRRSIECPQAVAGVGVVTRYSSRNYDPTIVIDEDIKDHKGGLIAKKGTQVNPLDYHSFGKPLILINGDDVRQVFWALSEQGKIVLIQGAPLLLSKEHKRTFFFDQGGILVKKFGISKIPARVSQKDKVLMIEEINLTGGNNERN